MSTFLIPENDDGEEMETMDSCPSCDSQNIRVHPSVMPCWNYVSPDVQPQPIPEIEFYRVRIHVHCNDCWFGEIYRIKFPAANCPHRNQPVC